ncbi:hypothetical protein CSB45_13695 [candidate division KSB3 bacterium]|uniref:Uncharacterized protein n=1 Tax=candidate division KSB3 bacterium TaxID=2044937 RepID=A0A2G6E1F1_9BACT|nr:MAG: hypothetical protein CSB45_13695 [candidate division KSB3 bacterium]
MPQLSKGGKYIFAWSIIQDNGSLTFPPKVVHEYKLKEDNFIYIFSGSKQTGGFCVTTNRLLSDSKLQNILTDNPELKDRTLKEGELIPYKGKKYAWIQLKDHSVYLSETLMTDLKIGTGDKLLSIRSSNIAFTMGLKGVLIDKAISYRGKIETY